MNLPAHTAAIQSHLRTIEQLKEGNQVILKAYCKRARTLRAKENMLQRMIQRNNILRDALQEILDHSGVGEQTTRDIAREALQAHKELTNAS